MRNRCKNILLLILVFLLACETNQKEESLPPNILSIDVFSKVLADFALAESAANLNIKNTAQINIDSVYAFNPLEENGIRKSQFDSTLDFYCHHSLLYKKVYENVLAKLTEFETKKNSGKDSIKLK